jgi:hypothetical protein
MLGAGERFPGYLPIAVEWSKAYQMHQPWAAWPYAFEAKYSNVETDRVRALAIGRYLDRHSDRIATTSPALKRKADEWLVRNKPFPQTRAAPAVERKL